jgi:hypothetical protein
MSAGYIAIIDENNKVHEMFRTTGDYADVLFDLVLEKAAIEPDAVGVYIVIDGKLIN